MATSSVSTIIGTTEDGLKICKTVVYGGLCASGGVYLNVPLSKATNVLSLVTYGCVEPYTVMEYEAQVTSGNQVQIGVFALASGTAIANATSAQTTSGELVLYTVGL